MGLAALLVVCGVLLARPGGLVAAQPVGSGLAQTVPGTPWLGFVGENINDIQVGSVNNLYGVEFTLKFDPRYVQVADDADPVTPGIQLAVGALFTGKPYFVARNQVDNINGTIDFAITLQAPATPISGGGVVAHVVKWKVLSCAEDNIASSLTFLNHNLSDPEGGAIAHEINNSKIPCPPAPPVCGTVLLQCRTNHAGTDVFLTEVCPANVFSAQAIIPNVPSTKTAADGSFCVTPYPGQTYQCLTAFRHGYLVGRKNNPAGNVGRITLPAGDMNEDDFINIFDLTIIASDYGCTTPPCKGDVNGDNTCNIFDLSCAAGNYGKSGPWTQWYPQ
jgi:hypothetical protein